MERKSQEEPGKKKKIYPASVHPPLTPEQVRAMLAARDLPEGPVVKQVLEWIAEVENHQRRIALPYVPDVRGGDRRADSGWRSLIKNHILSKKVAVPAQRGQICAGPEMISLAASTSPISSDLLLESALDPLLRCGAW